VAAGPMAAGPMAAAATEDGAVEVDEGVVAVGIGVGEARAMIIGAAATAVVRAVTGGTEARTEDGGMPEGREIAPTRATTTTTPTPTRATTTRATTRIMAAIRSIRLVVTTSMGRRRRTRG